MTDNPTFPDKPLSEDTRKTLLKIFDQDVTKAIKKARPGLARLIKADIE
jgi:hypothetical protein